MRDSGQFCFDLVGERGIVQKSSPAIVRCSGYAKDASAILSLRRRIAGTPNGDSGSSGGRDEGDGGGVVVRSGAGAVVVRWGGGLGNRSGCSERGGGV